MSQNSIVTTLPFIGTKFVLEFSMMTKDFRDLVEKQLSFFESKPKYSTETKKRFSKNL